MKGYKIRGKPLEKIFRQKRLFRQSHTQLIAGQAEVLVFVDRRQPVASPSAKMDRGIIRRKTNPICVQSIAHVILSKIGKRSMVACKFIHDRYVESTLESINKPIISRGKALRNRAETI